MKIHLLLLKIVRTAASTTGSTTGSTTKTIGLRYLRGLLALIALAYILVGCDNLIGVNGGILFEGWSYNKWDSHWEGVQTGDMEAVSVEIDNRGNTITTGNHYKTTGTNRVIVVKYDKNGNQTGLAEMPNEGNYHLVRSILDANGDIILSIIDFSDPSGDWRITKVSGTPDAQGQLPDEMDASLYRRRNAPNLKMVNPSS